MRVKLLLAAICAVAFSLPAGAHHSHGNYLDTFRDVEGVVTEVHFVVPHSWVYIQVKDAQRAAAAVGARGHRPRRTRADRRHEGVHQARRRDQSAVPSAERRLPWLSARVSESAGRIGQGLGRRDRTHACGLLDWSRFHYRVVAGFSRPALVRLKADTT